MADMDVFKLKIDEEFKKLIPPLSVSERKQLEENIVRDGCREPLCAWYDTILDGHNRYEICTRLQIPFSVTHIYMKNREEAVAWICANQLGRRNITEEARRYLIGKRYEVEKLLGAHNAKGINQHTRKKDRPKMLVEPRYSESAVRTAERLGHEYHLSHASINKYGTYAGAIDALQDVDPEFSIKIITGQIKISQENVLRLAQLSPEEIRCKAKQISDDSDALIGYADTRAVFPERTRVEKQFAAPSLQGTVKDMPAPDPDAEITGLTLTIPSWVSSMNRAGSLSNMNEVSEVAIQKLEAALDSLIETADSMRASAKEKTHG